MPDVDLLGMECGEHWLLRPVARQMCKYESLIDGTLSLQDVALMNEYLDIEVENQFRMRKVVK